MGEYHPARGSLPLIVGKRSNISAGYILLLRIVLFSLEKQIEISILNTGVAITIIQNYSTVRLVCGFRF